MCGISGYWAGAGQRPDVELAKRMAQALHSRGPDAEGAWVDVHAGLALSHRRLSIVDLSPAGAQPMLSADGRRVIVFNGEIYNHLELRRRLEQEGKAPPWRGHSDTETLLAACAAWGIDATLRASVGMFALALWDAEDRTLTLARDRLGEKPLYVGFQGGVLLFASELKALRAHPAWQGEISRAALELFLLHNYVPGPYCVYRGLCKLPPGSALTLSLGESRHDVQQECLALIESLPSWNGVARRTGRTFRLEPYWSLAEVATRGARDPFRGTDQDATEELEATLKRAVGLQMVADVPLGAFLSGGIDSSTVVALMQAQSARPVRTFSIGFSEAEYNEAPHAKAVARHLGTDHTELYVSPEDALAVIPQLPKIYDEPFSDSSQIPTHLVAALARRHVTVSLSGDGGDELFYGYPRFPLTAKMWTTLRRAPLPLRRTFAAVVNRLPLDDSRVAAVLPARLRRYRVLERLPRLASLAPATTADALYQDVITQWHPPPVTAPSGAITSIDRNAPLAPADLSSRLMYFDTLGYLPDDILVKVDRAAMAVSLETRVPLLDHRVVELAWRLPLTFKMRDGQTKWLLRQVLYRHVPRELIDRPKMGFGVPIGHWLRGPLRDWADSLLAPDRLLEGGLLDPEPIRRKWQEHRAGVCDWHYLLWTVLMWQAWHAEWR